MAPKGGRGKKADYRTIQVRCPEPLKFTVHQIIRRWHEQEFVPQPEPSKPLEAMSENEILAQIAALGKEYASRLPKSTEQQADEIVEEILRLMQKEGLSQTEQIVLAGRLAEECLG